MKTVPELSKLESKPCYKRIYHSKPFQLIKELSSLPLCLTPLWDLVTDIITIYLYYDTNNPNWATISLLILLYSSRTQFVFFMVIQTSDEVHAVDPRFYLTSPKKCINLWLLIPYLGPSFLCTRSCIISSYADMGDITTGEVTEVDWSHFSFKQCILAWLCAICSECFFASFGIIAGVIVVVYVVVKKFINHCINIMEICNCGGGGSNAYDEENQDKGKDKDKDEDKNRDESMFIILKFVEALTEALPQLALQCYIFITQNIYNDTYSVILFALSVTMSIISLLKLVYKMISNWEDVVYAFTIEVGSV